MLACSNPVEPDPGPIEPDPFPDAHDVRLWLGATGVVLYRDETFQHSFFVDEYAEPLHQYPPMVGFTYPAEFRMAWWSSDPRVLTVDSTGVVRAVAPGVAAVWVQVESERDSSVVRVASATDPAGPRYVSIGVGSGHTCARAEGGETYCWGSDAYAALGRGVNRWFTGGMTPEQVVAGQGYETLAVGSFHACGLVAGGDVWCWGKNFSGQLGNGERERDVETGLAFVQGESMPVRVVGAIAFDTIVAQNEATCGLDASGTAYCWGSNFLWELGIGSSDTGDARAEPTPVAGDLTFRLIAAGSAHACGVTSDEETYCWGVHNWAAPSGPQRSSFEPVLVAADLAFVQLVGGTAYSCGLTSARETYCWGFNNVGQLGHADLDGSETPTLLGGGFEFVALTAGREHTCGLTDAGRAFCWGVNGDGELGTGERNFTANPEPMPVVGGITFTALSAGGGRTCGIAPDGAAFCWGQGGLGNGRMTEFTAVTPVRVAAPIP
jgi:alpha-tubulin suppressor-like RCC1 family protein